jgi:hypothetical protein
MTAIQIGQLLASAALFAGGVALYRRRSGEDKQYGSQSAILMWAAAAIFLVLGLRLLEYRPSAAELEYAKEHSR